MKNKKVVLITIIVLLCVFAPLTIFSFIFKDDRNLLDENPKHEQFYEDSIWFYDNGDKLISKYECQTKICDFSVPTIDDGTYNINYYKGGTMEKVSVIDEKFTFITDGAKIYLYNITATITLNSYKAIKNYNVNLENNTYILQNEDGLWGAIKIGSSLGPVLPFEYDFIGLTDNLNEDNTLNVNKLIVLKENKWYIVDNTNNALSGYIDDPIIDYTDEYIFSKNGDRVRIFSYENFEYINNYQIKDYILEDKYIGIVTDNFLLIYDNLGTSYLKSITLVNNNGKIELEKVDNKLEVKVDNSIIETIELN